jgi:hypothetical protein
MMKNEFEKFINPGRSPDVNPREWIDPYVEINTDEGYINFRDKYEDSDTKTQLLVLLVAIHEVNEVGGVEDASMDPVELAKLADRPIGKAYPAIRDLEKNGLIKNVGQEYKINLNSSDQIKSKLENGSDPIVAD